jgi:hypothetical protein
VNLAPHLRLAGAGLILLASAHLVFPRRFGWKEELPRLSLLNRQMFLVHVVFIATMLVLFGGLSLFLAEDLLDGSRLARTVLAGFVVIWSMRLLTQLFVYDRSLWRGQRFPTLVHVGFTVFWAYLVLVYGLALAA